MRKIAFCAEVSPAIRSTAPFMTWQLPPNYKPFWARLMWRRTSLGDVLGSSVDAPIGCKQEFVSASETAAGDPVDFRANEAFDDTGQIFVESHEASQEYLAKTKTPG